MKTYSFEKLEVWQEARRLSVKIFHITRSFPEEEKFGITRQMRRAIVTVCSNIAEGVSRTSFKDQARFSEMSLNN